MQDLNDEFLAKLSQIPKGFSIGLYQAVKYRIIHTIDDDGRVEKLFGENLRGVDHISFNLYRLPSGRNLLKPCEMSEDKIFSFVMQVEIFSDKAV